MTTKPDPWDTDRMPARLAALQHLVAEFMADADRIATTADTLAPLAPRHAQALVIMAAAARTARARLRPWATTLVPPTEGH